MQMGPAFLPTPLSPMRGHVRKRALGIRCFPFWSLRRFSIRFCHRCSHRHPKLPSNLLLPNMSGRNLLCSVAACLHLATPQPDLPLMVGANPISRCTFRRIFPALSAAAGRLALLISRYLRLPFIDCHCAGSKPFTQSVSRHAWTDLKTSLRLKTLSYFQIVRPSNLKAFLSAPML